MPVLEDLRLAARSPRRAARTRGWSRSRAGRSRGRGRARAATREAASSERRGDLGVVLALEEPELPPVVVLELVEALVDLGADPADDAAAAAGQEVLGVGVLEERVAAPVEVALALADQRRHPLLDPLVEAEREHDELAELARPEARR